MEAPTPTLPRGGGAIRSIAEKFSANPATGSGSLSIPIAASPGRDGFGPQLAVQYDSGAGNGTFGVGWSLSMPSISRKTDKGLPRYRDAEDSDTFILAGSEDLVPLLKESAGVWSKDEVTEGALRKRRYRPRVEAEAMRIERIVDSSGGTRNVYWQTISKDNVTSVYGKSEAARIADPEDPRRIFRWLLEESRDDKGNVVRYHYKAEDLNGVRGLPEYHRTEKLRKEQILCIANRYPKSIQWGNTVTSPSTDSDFAFEIVFD